MKPERLLLVDDDVAFNFLNRLLIKGSGLNCEISECLDGNAALKFVLQAEKCPDVILLDINMPVMDGFEFLEEFEKITTCRQTKVFMLTSSTQDSDHTMTSKYSCVKGYFDKPLTEENVRKIVSTLEIP